jgi:sensor c-di-GMP phosphodiesterase-like protein
MLLDRHDLTPNAVGIEVTEVGFCDSRGTHSLQVVREFSSEATMEDFGVVTRRLANLPACQ